MSYDDDVVPARALLLDDLDFDTAEFPCQLQSKAEAFQLISDVLSQKEDIISECSLITCEKADDEDAKSVGYESEPEPSLKDKASSLRIPSFRSRNIKK